MMAAILKIYIALLLLNRKASWLETCQVISWALQDHLSPLVFIYLFIYFFYFVFFCFVFFFFLVLSFISLFIYFSSLLLRFIILLDIIVDIFYSISNLSNNLYWIVPYPSPTHIITKNNQILPAKTKLKTGSGTIDGCPFQTLRKHAYSYRKFHLQKKLKLFR